MQIFLQEHIQQNFSTVILSLKVVRGARLDVSELVAETECAEDTLAVCWTRAVVAIEVVLLPGIASEVCVEFWNQNQIFLF